MGRSRPFPAINMQGLKKKAARGRLFHGSARSGRGSVDRCVEGGARTHDCHALGFVGQVVATDVGRLALHRGQFIDDLLLAAGQGRSQRRKLGLERRILRLRRQLLCPVHGQIELAAQKEDAELATHFAKLAKTLTDNEGQIVAEMKSVQGKPVDIGGYYLADAEKTKAIMRPSPTLNAALKAIRG